VLEKQTTKAIDLLSLNPEHEDRTIPMAEVEWVARVIWASQ
jgi:phage repressor protein C with HTH and peptisase S24 domain